jgi:hypothetical protein
MRAPYADVRMSTRATAAFSFSSASARTFRPLSSLFCFASSGLARGRAAECRLEPGFCSARVVSAGQGADSGVGHGHAEGEENAGSDQRSVNSGHHGSVPQFVFSMIRR